MRVKVESTVGVIGAGFVGRAVANGFKRVTRVAVYDENPERSESPFSDVAEQDIVFVCVPTPTHWQTGECDLTILHGVAERLDDLQSRGGAVGLVVVKSTVPPGTVLEMSRRFGGLRFVSNPEFLTQRTADDDFLNPASVIIGTEPGPTGMQYFNVMQNLFRALVASPILHVSHNEAAMSKYARNCFFALKIAFMNELYQLCKINDSNFSSVRAGLLASDWVNPMHTEVPGPDGQLGFGGKCFPKDVKAFWRYAEECGVSMNTLFAALLTNNHVRAERDWEHIPGALA